MVEPLCERCRRQMGPHTIGNRTSKETGNSDCIEDAGAGEGDPGAGGTGKGFDGVESPPLRGNFRLPDPSYHSGVNAP